MSAPDTIFVPHRRNDPALMGPPQTDLHDAIIDAATYVGEDPGDWTATEYARVTPSVRLARWLDQDPERCCEAYMFDGKWTCMLYTSESAGPNLGEGDGLPSRDAALSAALDRAEGVRDAGH